MINPKVEKKFMKIRFKYTMKIMEANCTPLSKRAPILREINRLDKILDNIWFHNVTRKHRTQRQKETGIR